MTVIEGLRRVDKLEEYLKTTKVPHFSFTGTFDPVHRAHVDQISECLEATEVAESRIVVTPHNWNKVKTPIDLELRRQFFEMSVDEWIPHLRSRILILTDEVMLTDPKVFLAKTRLQRIVGEFRPLDPHAIIRPRSSSQLMSSSFVRESILEANINVIRGFVAESVIARILEEKLYQIK